MTTAEEAMFTIGGVEWSEEFKRWIPWKPENKSGAETTSPDTFLTDHEWDPVKKLWVKRADKEV